jgi:hypothetical protein
MESHFSKEIIGRIQYAAKADLEALHIIIYGNPGETLLVRRSLRRFPGFDCPIESNEYRDVMERVKIFEQKELQCICRLLNLEQSGSTDELGEKICSFLRKPAISEVQSTFSRSASKTVIRHDSYDERKMVTVREARSSTSKMTTMETEIAAEIQLANLEYQHERRIIELKLKLNRARHNGNASSVGTSCASKNLENSKFLLDTNKFSNSNERVHRWVSEIEPEERQAAFERRETASDITPTGREAAYDITSRGREAAYKIFRRRREAAPVDTQAVFAERDAAFERRSLDVDERKIVSQHQPDKKMNDQILQGAVIDQEERMNDQCLLSAGIGLATEIASSQLGAGIDLNDEDENDVQIFNLMEVLAHPNKFSSLLKLIRSAAWMNRLIQKTRNVSELTIEELEWANIRWYNYEQSQDCKTEIHNLTWKLQLKQSGKLIGLNPFLDDECV